MQQGDIGDQMFILLKGKCEIFTSNENEQGKIDV